MKRARISPWILSTALLLLGVAAVTPLAAMTEGKPDIRSMSALTFGPEGVLFVGDGKGGAVFAIDVGDAKPDAIEEPLAIRDIEEEIAALLGVAAGEVMIHDMAVNPVSQRVYLAVSRGRGAWDSRWKLPNDIADATILLRIDHDGKLGEVALDKVPFARAALSNPIDPGKKHQWKEGISLRSDTITDMAFSDGHLLVAGLSNEEFASTMWKIPYPFAEGATATTLEIFHGAHGAWETHAPIRTFVPYSLEGESHLLAAYLCTPLVTFREDQLEAGKHAKGRTVAEFGSGNYPLDMVVYQKGGRDLLLIANSNLPLMIVDPKDIESYDGEITTEPDTYEAGVPYETRSGAGIQQLDLLNPDYVIALHRLPGGTLDLASVPVRRF